MTSKAGAPALLSRLRPRSGRTRQVSPTTQTTRKSCRRPRSSTCGTPASGVTTICSRTTADTPGWYDIAEDFYAVNWYYFYKADRTRNQLNASMTKFASGFAGDHNLKFGAEFERSYIKSEYGYNGGAYINSNFGVPVLRVPVGRLSQGQHQHSLCRVRAG